MVTKRSQLKIATALTCLPCLGHTFVPVDFDRLTEFKTKAYGDHIQYLFGGKDPNVGSGQIDFPKGIDCSGWNQTLLDYITHGVLNPGDGSYNQGHAMIDMGLRVFSIGSAQQYLDHATANDNLFRVGYHWPGGRGGDSIGHVFPMMHNHTSESYGGHGPGERPSTHKWFVDHCDLIAIVGPILSPGGWNDKTFNPYV
jgi:hypothetical protein